MDIQFWIIYASVVFFASIIPGPSMLLALTHGVKFGVKKSLATAFGNTTASILQATIAISGLSIILTTSEFLFFIVKTIGALYLIYLGIMLFRTPFNKEFVSDKDFIKDTSLLSMFNQAFFVAIGNPKAIVFFTALFPQFINTNTQNNYQYVLMIIILGLIAFLTMMIYSLAGDKASEFFRNSKLGEYFNKIVGSIFVGAGCSIALSK
jgi:threonine/homoserine/homoserine lactone efflux protein